MKGRFGAFIVGGLVGSIAALLYTPRTGVENRALVADKANEALIVARQYGNEAQIRGQELYSNVAEQGRVAYESAAANVSQAYSSAAAGARDAFGVAQARVADACETVKPAFEERNDDLRGKIEAARQRIAAQVAKNTEEAVTSPEPVEVVVDEQVKVEGE